MILCILPLSPLFAFIHKLGINEVKKVSDHKTITKRALSSRDRGGAPFLTTQHDYSVTLLQDLRRSL